MRKYALTATPRQEEVVQLLSLGLTEKQVAAELQISWQTVHAHVKRLYKRYGVGTRIGLLRRMYGASHKSAKRHASRHD